MLPSGEKIMAEKQKLSSLEWCGWKKSEHYKHVLCCPFQLAQKLREEIEDGEVVVVDDGAEDKLPDEERNVFEQLLPIAEKEVSSGPDSLFEKVLPSTIANQYISLLDNFWSTIARL